MTAPREKGTKVNPTELGTKIPSHQAGLVSLPSFLPSRGAGRSSTLLLVLALIATFALGLSASPARAASGAPQSLQVEATNVTTFSAHLQGVFKTNDFETEYKLEYTTEPSNGGSWAAVPGGAGTIPAAYATTDEYSRCGVSLSGLDPATAYFVRLFVKNSQGESTSPFKRFETAGPPPPPTTFTVHALHGEAVRVLGDVEPGGQPISEEQTITVGGGATAGTFTLAFEGETTDPITFDTHETAPGESHESDKIYQAMLALPGIQEGGLSVTEDFVTSTYTVQFIGELRGENLPQVTADASGLTPSGTVTVATVQDGSQFPTRHYFEYVTQQHFEVEGFANASATPNLETVGIVGADLPGLIPGTEYRYRLLASDSVGAAIGEPQSLTVPVPAATGPEPACPNQALRTGSSARLPDCRAYEQITPVEKGGALDIYTYAASSLVETLFGRAGNEVMIRNASAVDWGSSPDPTLPSYVFSRSSDAWRMTSTHPVAETGGAPSSYLPAASSSDFIPIGVEVGWGTVVNRVESPNIEFEVGPPGGPYTIVASVPRTKQAQGDGWVAASADGTKFILATHDRTLLGLSTGTTSGADLYEYSSGELHQLNVLANGSKISFCGATLAGSRADSISVDGSRVLFTDNCTHHLYMRFDGGQPDATTVDLGEYLLGAANPQLSRLLLEKRNGSASELFLYESESAALTPLVSSGPGGAALDAKASEDLSTIYLSSRERLTPDAPPLSPGSEWAGSGNLSNLYRYDVATESLSFVVQSSAESGFDQSSASPDGRFFYWEADGVPGVPGGGPYPAGFLLGGEFREEEGETKQVFRYDASQGAVQCMSCSSSFDRLPKRPAEFGSSAYSSANGDYVIFHTAAALVPQDVNGESPAALEPGGEGLNNPEADFYYSASSDVYEWRANGTGGCSQIEGCLALITSGAGGLRNTVLGITPSGRDLFFVTHSALAPSDEDSAGDVYNARIEGGFAPPPPSPVECEGDACHSPAAAPSEPTLSTSVSSGAGNQVSKHLKKHHRKHHRTKGHHKRASHNRRGQK
jgi:hypothetical protein